MFDKNLTRLLSILVIVLAIFLAIQAYNGFQEGKYIGKDIMPSNTITVSAAGEVFAKPDIAQISVSAVREAKTVLEAQKSHTESINKIVAYLKDSGIEEKDIRTSAYNIYPRYDYLRDKGQVFRGYEVSQTLDVKIRDLEKVGKILGGVAEMGANQVGGINFVIDDEDAVKEEARKQAIDKAKEKADQIAKDLGVSFGRLVSFYESSGDFPIYRSYMTEGMGGAELVPAPEIPAGENKVTITVNLTYEIK
ncbi:SIMPL domain-containing protein [Patescibacteria group bacterium]|nr:SIMPL domain-containing protein [Patescibacteria group bacterium]